MADVTVEKVIIVTGASRGFSALTVDEIARPGHHV
jgi:NADP-dependent 3-hydroxy acid dehydrogenase YdfG